MSIEIHALVIDDHKSLREIITMKLEGMDCKVTTAEDGNYCDRPEVALEGYDLIITDYSMVDMDGLMVLNMVSDLRHPMPCMLHSGQETAIICGEKVSLFEAVKKFPFAAFELKTVDNMSYIVNFVNSVRKEKERRNQ